MKCPKCGAVVPEGSLYCEHCGEDIHIVPDYDPQLELYLKQSMHGIIKEVNGTGTKQEEGGRKTEDNITTVEFAEIDNYAESQGFHNDQDSLEPISSVQAEDASIWMEPNASDSIKESSGRHGKKKIAIALLGIVGICLILAIVSGMVLYHYNSYEYQLKKAVEYQSNQQYEQAIKYYERALELDSKDIEVRFSLAESYYQKGNKIEYEYLLRGIIRDKMAEDEQLERAYRKLITIYRDRDEYQTIHEILLACENEKIRTTYQDYIAYPPEFSYQEGYYTEIVPLKLTALSSGKIYYTLDGAEPDEKGTEYTAPVFLDHGDHTVKAYFVNEYGVASVCVTKNYHVNITQIAAPNISVISGDYTYPILIEVLDYEDEDVYYTTDGTDPDRHSTLYSGPIPMPIGKSHFKFAYIKEDGSISNIAERTYQLKLNTDLTPQDAEQAVVESMIDAGKIYDYEGYYDPETPAQYLYQYQAVRSIYQSGDFYIIAEIFKDEDGIMSKTGSAFAVDIYSGALFKLQLDENSNYTLVEILIDSQEG